MAITDLTITSEREEVVDFTIPFMNTGTIEYLFVNLQKNFNYFILQVLPFYI